MYEVEKSVYKALQDLPAKISQVYQGAKAYRGTEEAAELNCYIISLYIAVLKAYTTIMKFFTRKTRCR